MTPASIHIKLKIVKVMVTYYEYCTFAFKINPD